MMNKKQIPITILTGFLGSGKTTFLNHLIEKNSNIRYAIIENEFGEQSIDSELILRPSEAAIVELNNGCLCCTLNDNLYDILNELFDRREEFDEIVIEATGVADPVGLAEPFVAHSLIKEQFPLKGIICLVDSELIEEQIENSEEAIQQITFSDMLLLNKSDLVSDSTLMNLKQKMHNLNPLAKIFSGNKDSFPEIDLTQEDTKIEELFLQNKLKLKLSEKELNFPLQKPHSHHHHKHTEKVNSQTFIFDKPFNYAKLENQLFIYLTLQAKDLYRMKGLVWMQGSEQQYVVQSVGKRLDFEKKQAWKTDTKKQSIIIFIGKNLQRKGLEKLLNRCLA